MSRLLTFAAGVAVLGFAGCSDDDFGQTNPHADLGVVVSTGDLGGVAGADMHVSPATNDGGADLSVATPVDLSAPAD